MKNWEVVAECVLLCAASPAVWAQTVSASAVVQHSPATGTGAAESVLGSSDGVVTNFDNVGSSPGYVVVEFAGRVVADVPGTDLVVHLFDWVDGQETFRLLGSMDLVDWTTIVTTGTPSGSAGAGFDFPVDLATYSPGRFRFLKLENGTVDGGSPFEGPDIDAFSAVVCIADLTGDDLVDFADYLEFLNLFDAGDLFVDFNGDGLIDFSDFLEFLNLYEIGC